MRLIEIVKLVAKLMTIPDLKDKEACREWLLLVADALDLIVARTTTTADDAVLDFVTSAIRNDSLFDPFYQLILNLLSSDGRVVVGDTVSAPLLAEADRAGINPLVLIELIQAVIAILRQLNILKQ